MLYNGQIVDTQRYVIELARIQRLNLTKSEQIMWLKLKNKQVHGYKFRCQHPVYRYILDFFCHKAMLAIEIDGDIHKDRKEYDMYRDQYMESIGIKTLRFSASEVFSNIDHVINQIIYVLKKRTESYPIMWTLS